MSRGPDPSAEACTIIAFIAFNKTPSVDINDLTSLPVFTPEHVKTAHTLSESFTDFGGPRLFLLIQTSDESDIVV